MNKCPKCRAAMYQDYGKTGEPGGRVYHYVDGPDCKGRQLAQAEERANVAAAHQSGFEEGAMDLAAMKDRAEKAEAAECGNGPCGDALDALWDDIILAHKPNYGEWEYPGMAARHITAAFYDLRADNVRLREVLADAQDYICSGITDATAHAILMDEINALLDDTEQAAREKENDDER